MLFRLTRRLRPVVRLAALIGVGLVALTLRAHAGVPDRGNAVLIVGGTASKLSAQDQWSGAPFSRVGDPTRVE
ncbi:MAG: hypothetical protein JNM13_12140 [Hyphomicrobiaceae bacterium]|nr:hypothetical protein [Hyphomicrobiaceae bacterium]